MGASEPVPSGRRKGPATAGRAFLVYTAYRLLLFAVVFALLVSFLDLLLALGAAVLLSAVLSVSLLRRQREDLTRLVAARAENRRVEKAELRSRLRDDGA